MKALLTIEEAAKLTRLSVKTIYTYAERETIPHIKLGRRVLFEEDKLEEWVTSCSVIPEGISEKSNNTEEETAEADSSIGEPA
ncbi:MAG: helix-turn-helix domain-containing protein [Spirochaetales bacterium]|uniref:Helix-turn-helix domain-containing protein n=1 Tax=Candidatus Thalassospirochaeta sargassi TaxID=3119039 RepID=A0AAJ1ML59_9SPIO|nr:helix-turn-helix domain-containing protein [Spirochaetales bacterium]